MNRKTVPERRLPPVTRAESPAPSRSRCSHGFFLGLLLFAVACDSGTDPDPPRPSALTISPTSARLSSLGETAAFTAKITDQNGDAYDGTVTWSSSDGAVFTVTAQGVVSSVGNGSGTLTASFQDLSATAPVVVEQVPAAIAISPESAMLSSLGETAAFTAAVTDANGAEAPGTPTWSSNDTDVFTVDADGRVTAVANGTAVLTASLANLSEQAQVVVEQVAVALTVSPDSARLASLGDTAAFTATLTDALGSEVAGTPVWSSSDRDVFVVEAGVVTAVGNGTGTLGAAYKDLRATAPVVVEQVPVALLAESGDGQMGTVGLPLADPLVVRVDDAGGSPIEGVSVDFAPAQGHGAADPGTADTDTDGLSQTLWTLGPDSGVHTLTASLPDGLSVEFTASARPREPRPDSALYRIEFEATWSDSTHPDDFPSGAHFSPLIGGVHNDSASFWELGDTASPGMEDMAESGRTRTLAAEIREEIPDNALAVVEGVGTRSPGSTEIDTVVVNVEHPLVTLVTMIAPSPDWFAGVTGQSLLDEDGEWVEELRVLLYPLDAGTDSGNTYTSPNQNTSPQEPISSLKGMYPFSDEPVGTYVFKLIGKSDGG